MLSVLLKSLSFFVLSLQSFLVNLTMFCLLLFYLAQVKFEASCTLGYLSDSSVDSFQLLCMTSVPFSRKYDQVIQ